MRFKKSQLHCSETYIILKEKPNKSWYFDSGSSRYMIKKCSLYRTFKDNKLTVTFNGDKKSRIVGKVSIQVDGIPKLNEFLYVEGLKANLISICQICGSKNFPIIIA